MPPAQPSTTPRRKKGEGQWALGYRTPLNANEQVKRDDDGLNVRARILDVYARGGFESIDGQDLRGRMRWWGLYTQRRQGIPGGQTATLDPAELDDEYFMLRVRIDGGGLSLAQLRVLAGISTDFARGTADITDRQNIQYHWIRIEDMPEVWARLELVGLITTEACGDTPRTMLGSPVAGIAADEILDGTPALEEIRRRYIGSPEFSNLPRKFKTSVSGSPRQDVAPELDDVSFVGVEHPEHGPGFDVWVGGGLSTNPMLAKRLGAWVPLDEVPEVWAAVVSVFRDYGYRRLRNRARLKFLVADWGVERFREVMETEYLHRPMLDGPAPTPPRADERDHIGVHPQKDGLFYVGVAPRTGRVNGTLLGQVADLVESVGSDRVRLTPQQHLLVLDVPGDRVEELVAALAALDLPARPSSFRRGTMACTGIEFCKLAIVETKARASAVIDELERRMPEFDAPLSVHLNGCPNACARTQTADIGLKGMVMTGADGEHVDGFQVHLGGGLGLHAGFGRKLRGLKVTAEELPDYIERVTTRFSQQRQGDEAFAAWVARAEEADLT
ncbi:sulfite reductase (ferredoxin) [Motilibacter peucedani]|uniref:assimilatory sulfite reductase (ferredoxin) n=1 Tax=Motilibacter peucedani TaxID=598650 RepID=A0A420XS24_9ACTN|nr:nitrite/sulfite reductase [Motilibacter peucedani]RKS77703.1 sulfite reductase (ferredoxin) [Motilibacter peucedani]